MDPFGDFLGLKDVSLRRRTEAVHGLFVAEGAQTVLRALDAGYVPRTLVIAPRRAERVDVKRVVRRVGDAGGQVHVDEEERLSGIAGFDVHRGVLASFERRALLDVTEVADGARTLAVLEAVIDHTNVGAVFRSAAALGADGVVLDPRCADPLYRRAVRTSMGAVFAVPYARCAAWPGGLLELRPRGFRVVALTPEPDATDLADLEVGSDEKVALVLGTEGRGLSQAAVEAADDRASIGMRHGVDSLNVAACAAVAFWALTRARERDVSRRPGEPSPPAPRPSPPGAR